MVVMHALWRRSRFRGSPRLHCRAVSPAAAPDCVRSSNERLERAGAISCPWQRATEVPQCCSSQPAGLADEGTDRMDGWMDGWPDGSTDRWIRKEEEEQQQQQQQQQQLHPSPLHAALPVGALLPASVPGHAEQHSRAAVGCPQLLHSIRIPIIIGNDVYSMTIDIHVTTLLVR